MKENLFQQNIEKKIEEGEEIIDTNTHINETKLYCGNILSDFSKLLNYKGFKKYKVIVNGEKGKVISNTIKKGIFVKFDNSGEIKHYLSIEEIQTFKILKENKKHKKKQ